MTNFLDMISRGPKGMIFKPKYYPKVGDVCLVSGPHDDDDNGYVYVETTVLWCNDIFVLYGKDGFWPVLNKWEHCLFKAREIKHG